MTGELTYVYAVGDPELATDADLVDLPGVGRGTVRTVGFGSHDFSWTAALVIDVLHRRGPAS